MNFSLLLAWRTLNEKKSGPIRLMLGICFLSIFTATFALSLIVAVMHGFEIETHKKLQGVHDDITISAYGDELNYKSIEKILKKEFKKNIKTFRPRATAHALILHEDQTHVALVTGIQIDTEYKKKFSKLFEVDSNAIESLTLKNNFLISSRLKEYLSIDKDNSLHLALASEPSGFNNKIYFDKVNGSLVGTFKSGMEDFDMNVTFCSLETFEKLFNIGITQIGINAHKKNNSEKLLQKLRLRFGPQLDITSWQEMYPPLIQALKLEKYAMFFILALIVLVACMSILSLLFMLINQKRVEIAIMRAHGIRSSTIKYAYLILGSGISGLASLLGTTCSWIIAWALNAYKLISLPDIYCVSHVPALMSFDIIIAVIILTLILSLCACSIATYKIASLNIGNVLRFESQ